MKKAFVIIFFLASAYTAEAMELRPIGSFQSPTYLTNDGTNRLYVTEREGVIRVKDSKGIRVFLNIKNLVGTRGESGLLSMAFDPRFRENRRFYVYYVDRKQNIRIDGFRAKRKPGQDLTRRTRVNIITIHSPPDTHKGGQIVMTHDGYLLFATGDGGNYEKPGARSQDRRSLLGKLIRIKPNPTSGQRANYLPHPDNPYIRGGGRKAILASGFRNPWRFSLDSKYPNQIWIADVGHSRYEEINRASLRDIGGANFGWPCYEGRSPLLSCRPKHKKPAFVYRHNDGRCSVTGGYVNRSSTLPRRGSYFYGDFCSGEIRTYRKGVSRRTGLSVPQLVSFGQDSRDNLYAISLNGAVYRLSN